MGTTTTVTAATAVTSTTTPTCFQVAITDAVATTALSQVSACTGKKKRSIDDAPLDDVKRAEIAPSSSDLRTVSTEEDDVQSSAAADRNGRFWGGGWTSK